MKSVHHVAGDFAETVREQFLAERVEYFKELQRLLYVEASNEESASKQMLVRALCKSDPDMGEKQVFLRLMHLYLMCLTLKIRALKYEQTQLDGR